MRKPSRNKDLIDLKNSLPCVACGKTGNSPAHHLRHCGQKTDEHWAVIPLCIDCHMLGPNAVHRIGLIKFAEKFPSVEKWLKANDWEYDKLAKWNHYLWKERQE